MNDDLHAYSGQYALDSLDADLVPLFERHLAECAVCQQEVHDFHKIADVMGEGFDSPPPPHIRSAVLSSIRSIAQEPAAVTTAEPIRAPLAKPTPLKHRPTWLLPLAIAASLVLIVGVVRNVSTTKQVTAASVLGAADVRVVELESPTGVVSKAYVSASKDRVVFSSVGLSPAPDGRLYELWLIGSGKPQPAGLFQTKVGVPTNVLVEGKASGQRIIAVTLEASSGASQPTTDIVIKGGL